MTTRKSVGGAATAGGMNYQYRATAWVAVQILSETAGSRPWELPVGTTLGRVDELLYADPCGHKMNKSQEGMTQFLIPRGNTAKVFEPIKESFHLVA